MRQREQSQLLEAAHNQAPKNDISRKMSNLLFNRDINNLKHCVE